MSVPQNFKAPTRSFGMSVLMLPSEIRQNISAAICEDEIVKVSPISKSKTTKHLRYILSSISATAWVEVINLVYKHAQLDISNASSLKVLYNGQNHDISQQRVRKFGKNANGLGTADKKQATLFDELDKLSLTAVWYSWPPAEDSSAIVWARGKASLCPMTEGVLLELVRADKNVEPETYQVVADAERDVEISLTISKHIDKI